MANITKSENDLWQNECYKAKTSFNRVQNGKGSRSRTNTRNPLWRNNYDRIFKKNKKVTNSSPSNKDKNNE